MSSEMSAARGEVAVIHLVWAPLGVEPLRRFVDAYAAHPAGREHRLIVVYNGVAAGTDLHPWREVLADFRHEEFRLNSPLLDLAAYHEAFLGHPAETYCFLNSYSQPLVSDWLRLLVGHLDDPTIAAVGATGSYESIRTTSHPLTRWRKRDIPPFPNPHLRTNAFAARRQDLTGVQWPMITSKMEALRFESGGHGLTRQLQRLGRAVVAGRDGRAYDVGAWRESQTFRAGSQSNLLISDNRTREYLTASPERRHDLERRAWHAR